MDIYFCDVCAARVTDSHLRRGHGVRKHDAVVCASCIEQGYSPDMQEEAERQGRSISSPEPLAGAAVLDESRDRAATYPDEPQPEAGASM
ncbi:MAG: hypothetical protein ACOCXJ_09790, partial [Planctomycetota bacterium]